MGMVDSKDAILEKKLDVAEDNMSYAKRECAKTQDVVANEEKTLKIVQQDILSL